MKCVGVMDHAGRLIIGDLVNKEGDGFVLDNVFVLEHILAPGGVGRVGVVTVSRPLVGNVGLLNGVRVLPSIWFEILEGSPLYSYVSEERQKIRAAALGIVAPELVQEFKEM